MHLPAYPGRRSACPLPLLLWTLLRCSEHPYPVLPSRSRDSYFYLIISNHVGIVSVQPTHVSSPSLSTILTFIPAPAMAQKRAAPGASAGGGGGRGGSAGGAKRGQVRPQTGGREDGQQLTTTSKHSAFDNYKGKGKAPVRTASRGAASQQQVGAIQARGDQKAQDAVDEHRRPVPRRQRSRGGRGYDGCRGGERGPRYGDVPICHR